MPNQSKSHFLLGPDDVAQTFLSAGSRDFPVPCWKHPVRGRNWQLEAEPRPAGRQNPQAGNPRYGARAHPLPCRAEAERRRVTPSHGKSRQKNCSPCQIRPDPTCRADSPPFNCQSGVGLRPAFPSIHESKNPSIRSNQTKSDLAGSPSLAGRASAVADCCRSCCRFVAILVVGAQRCSRCCRFSSVYVLCNTSSSTSIPATTPYPQPLRLIPGKRAPIALPPINQLLKPVKVN